MKVIEGDLMDIEAGVIVHQVNCRNRIGAGVSGAIIKKYPEVEKDYHWIAKTRSPEDLLGCWRFINVTDKLQIINLFTQLDYGNSAKTGVVYTNMSLLITRLHQICEKFKKKGRTVYVPYGIGCGLAGGDWAELERGCEDIENLVAVKLMED